MIEPSPTAASPPKLPFTLTLGVTGHRRAHLGEAVEGVAARLDSVIGEIEQAGQALAKGSAAFFADRPAMMRLVSPLADGADQLAAEIALARGAELHAVLPFARADYAEDFTADGGDAGFAALLAKAKRVLELPGTRADSLQAYVMAGRATIAHCDVLIAVWDGEPPRGRGGTGEVVEIALLSGTPIVHIPVDPALPVRLLWSELDPNVFTNRQNSHLAARSYDRPALDAMLAALLDPPVDPVERAYLSAYSAEHERHWNARIEYPLLLTLTGVRRIGRGDLRTAPLARTIEGEWADFRARCVDCSGVRADLELLRSAYCWADQLASHFAQTYRSGHVFNFVLGAIAVVMALAGLLLPSGTVWLALAELAPTALVIANTRVGVDHRWHRRWLDYRNLAERLRPMRSLKLLAIAAPQSTQGQTSQRWIDWYAATMWRVLGLPEGALDQPAVLAEALAVDELQPQIAYHRAAAHSAERLDHRLHLIGTGLFVASLIGCAVVIAGYLLAPEWVQRHSALFTALSAGLPALGTAIFGIRVQGDFAGTAQRSRSTADALDAIKAEVGPGTDLARSADLFERAAEAMRADLGEWRLAYRQRELTMP